MGNNNLSTGNTNWTAPGNVTNVFIQVWGGGGGGGGGNASFASAAGASAAFAQLNNYAVQPGLVHVVTCGNAGNGGAANANGTNGITTIFRSETNLNATVCQAQGGARGNRTSTSNSAGGKIANSIGNVRFEGANGAGRNGGTGTWGGSGGGSAGNAGNGSVGSNLGVNAAGGAGGSGTSGNGGNTYLNLNAENGLYPGGGGGGGGATNKVGGRGGAGRVFISWDDPPPPSASLGSNNAVIDSNTIGLNNVWTNNWQKSLVVVLAKWTDSANNITGANDGTNNFNILNRYDGNATPPTVSSQMLWMYPASNGNLTISVDFPAGANNKDLIAWNIRCGGNGAFDNQTGNFANSIATHSGFVNTSGNEVLFVSGWAAYHVSQLGGGQNFRRMANDYARNSSRTPVAGSRLKGSVVALNNFYIDSANANYSADWVLQLAAFKFTQPWYDFFDYENGKLSTMSNNRWIDIRSATSNLTVSANAIIDGGNDDTTDAAILNRNLESVNQFICLDASVAPKYSGVMGFFRYNNAAEPFYMVSVYKGDEVDGMNTYLARFNNANDASPLILGQNASNNYFNGAVIGITLRGTGTAVTARIWLNCDDTIPNRHDRWDNNAANFVITTANANANVNTGNMGGIGGWRNNATWSIIKMRIGKIPLMVANNNNGNFSDTFDYSDGNLNDSSDNIWTANFMSAIPMVSGNRIYCNNNDQSQAARFSLPSNTTRQYGRATIDNVSLGWLCLSFRMNMTNSLGAPCYIVNINTGSAISLMHWNGVSFTTFQSNGSASFANNDIVGVTLEGHYNYTTFRIFKNPTNATPSNAEHWDVGDTPYYNWTGDPTGNGAPSRVEETKGLGILLYKNTAGNIWMDNWYGGDAPAPTYNNFTFVRDVTWYSTGSGNNVSTATKGLYVEPGDVLIGFTSWKNNDATANISQTDNNNPMTMGTVYNNNSTYSVMGYRLIGNEANNMEFKAVFNAVVEDRSIMVAQFHRPSNNNKAIEYDTFSYNDTSGTSLVSSNFTTAGNDEVVVAGVRQTGAGYYGYSNNKFNGANADNADTDFALMFWKVFTATQTAINATATSNNADTGMFHVLAIRANDGAPPAGNNVPQKEDTHKRREIS